MCGNCIADSVSTRTRKNWCKVCIAYLLLRHTASGFVGIPEVGIERRGNMGKCWPDKYNVLHNMYSSLYMSTNHSSILTKNGDISKSTDHFVLLGCRYNFTPQWVSSVWCNWTVEYIQLPVYLLHLIILACMVVTYYLGFKLYNSEMFLASWDIFIAFQ